MPMDASDFTVVVIVNLFFSGKFFTIFSFLFGVGVFVQIERVRARGAKHIPFSLRRSLGLLFIAYVGIAGTIRPWILVSYAVLGIALLLFVNRSLKVILSAASITTSTPTACASVTSTWARVMASQSC